MVDRERPVGLCTAVLPPCPGTYSRLALLSTALSALEVHVASEEGPSVSGDKLELVLSRLTQIPHTSLEL